MQNKHKKHPSLFIDKSSDQGFTLIELLISLAMVAIITGAVLQVARFSDTHKSLTLATDEFRAVLRTAQSSALSIPIDDISDPDKRHICGYGVYIENDARTYQLFYTTIKGSSFDSNPFLCRDEAGSRQYGGNPSDTKTNDLQEFKLEDDLTFTGSMVDESIFFVAPYGEVCDENGDFLDETSTDKQFTIQKTSGSGSRDIFVNAFGKIN